MSGRLVCPICRLERQIWPNLGPLHKSLLDLLVRTDTKGGSLGVLGDSPRSN